MFCIYNRLEYTKKTFQQIKKAKPKKLFIAADGPVYKNKKDKINCLKTREWVLENIDWKCELKLFFSGKNLGCQVAMKGAIDWFFLNVEYGIILEDDCVASDSFFKFCTVLLERYKSDEKVMNIIGFNNFHNKEIWSESSRKKISRKNTDYVFLKGEFHEFGIATWRRAWLKNDTHLGKWPEYKKKELDKFYDDKNFTENLKKELEYQYAHMQYCWGHAWRANIIMNNGLYIMPLKNMINNIGIKGVHFQDPDLKKLHQKTYNIDTSNLKHPKSIEIDDELFRIRYATLFKELPKKKYSRKIVSFLIFISKTRKFKICKYAILVIIMWELIQFLYSILFPFKF